MIPDLGLVVELQRKLDIPGRLRCLNNSSRRCIHRRVRYGKVHAVKCIQEVSAELQLESFRKLDILDQADIPVVVPRSTQSIDLWGAGSESGRRIRIVAGVKPQETAPLFGCGVLPSKDRIGAVAIRSQTT